MPAPLRLALATALLLRGLMTGVRLLSVLDAERFFLPASPLLFSRRTRGGLVGSMRVSFSGLAFLPLPLWLLEGDAVCRLSMLEQCHWAQGAPPQQLSIY